MIFKSTTLYRVVHKGTYRYIPTEQIQSLDGDSCYTWIKTSTEQFLVARTIAACVTFLEQSIPMVRIHRSYAVNLSYVRELSEGSQQVLLLGGEVIPVSRRLRPLLKVTLNVNRLFNPAQIP